MNEDVIKLLKDFESASIDARFKENGYVDYWYYADAIVKAVRKYDLKRADTFYRSDWINPVQKED